MPKVSVLIPCYNSEKYLVQCLSSLVVQTLKDIEFICINDGSTDSTKSILKQFAKQDSRFSLINKKNTGYGNSLNLGLRLARGDYIGIIEPDDFTEPNMFESLYHVALANDLDVARCSYYYHSKCSESVQDWSFVPKNVVVKPINCLAIFKQGPSVWANLYKKSWLKSNRIAFLETPGASFQDTSFCFKTYFLAERFMMIDLPLLHYRIDNENSSVHDMKKILCVMDEWKEIYCFISQYSEENIAFVEKLPELQHRTYLWNLGRLNFEGRKLFVREWHNESIHHREKKQTKIFALTPLHALIECIVLYCPLALFLYNKNSKLIKFFKRFFF